MDKVVFDQYALYFIYVHILDEARVEGLGLGTTNLSEDFPLRPKRPLTVHEVRKDDIVRDHIKLFLQELLEQQMVEIMDHFT